MYKIRDSTSLSFGQNSKFYCYAISYTNTNGFSCCSDEQLRCYVRVEHITSVGSGDVLWKDKYIVFVNDIYQIHCYAIEDVLSILGNIE